MRDPVDDNPVPGAAGSPSEIGPGRSADQGATDNPDEIRGEIIQTRAQMTETLNAIQQRLDPDRLKAQARDEVEQLKDRVKDEVRQELDRVKGDIHDATIGKAEHFMREVDYQAREAGNSLLDRIRANPVPAALAGFGLAWLFMSGGHTPRRHPRARYAEGSRGYRRYPYGEGYARRPSDLDYYDSYDYGRGNYGEGQYPPRESGQAATPNVGQSISSAASGVAGQVQNQVSQLGDQVQGQVQQVGQQVQQLGDQVQDQFSTVEDQVQGRFEDFSGELQDEFTHLRWRAQRAMRENPLAMGVLAMAVGAAVGMMVPETTEEDRLLGRPREQLVQRAGAAAQDALEKVQDRVQQVAEQANQSVDTMASNASQSSGQPSGSSRASQPSGSSQGNRANPSTGAAQQGGSSSAGASGTNQSTQQTGSNQQTGANQSRPSQGSQGGQSRVA